MTRADRSEWQLALPMAGFFLLFFVGPLAILVSESLTGAAGGARWTLAHYTRFLGDPFYLSILWSTL